MIVGTGLFLGWSQPLRIAIPIEVHIHAKNWGFMALAFAGLLIDLYPRWFERKLASPGAVTAIFWMMTVGAFGLVVGPWVQPAYALWFSVPALALHLTATIWLLASMVKPIWADRKTWGPGVWHIVTSYLWFLAPVLIAPLIIFKVPGFPGAGIEANAPQALVYGWVLHFGYAVIPYLLSRVFFPQKPASLGGSWFGLYTVHIGGVFLWASIFLRAYQGPLRGIAYAFWIVSLIPMAVAVWRIIRVGLANLEEENEDFYDADDHATLTG